MRALAGRVVLALAFAVPAPVRADGQCPAVAPSALSLDGPPGAHRHHLELPSNRHGFAIARAHYLHPFDPRRAPLWIESQDVLRLKAAPGEWEPFAFAVVGRWRQRDVQVQLSELKGPRGTIPRASIHVRAAPRAAERKVFDRPETIVGSRFLPRWRAVDMGRREFREVFVDVYVPDGTPPGTYRGRLTIRSHRGEERRTVELRVRPIDLVDDPDKGLGIYYTVTPQLRQPERLRRELADLRAHGVRDIVSGLRVHYDGPQGLGVPDARTVERGIEALVEAGFRGTVVVDAGFVHLAQVLGHDDVAYAFARGESLDGEAGQAFREAASQGLAELRRIADAHPEVELSVTVLDELFNRNRLDLFLRFGEVLREEPRLPVFATFHTFAPEHDDMRGRIDPFVDIRCHHGYTFEWWLQRGNRAEDYARELSASGDRAWFYHNRRGAYFTPAWARIINGSFLWASPFTDHVPWMYEHAQGNPFDDTDCAWHDFGMAFPDPNDPSDIVPTRVWQATREGHDDLRYFATLEREIERVRRFDPAAVVEAEAFLAGIRERMFPSLPLSTVDMQKRRTGTAGEAPLMHALGRRLPGPTLDGLRNRAADLIATLQKRQG